MQRFVKKTHKKKVIIIGGGPAGLTSAYELSKVGVESIVLEKDHTVGGIARTINYKNYYFDIGGHRFFTEIKRVEDMWKKILGNDLLRCQRFSRIYYNKKFFYYPLKPFQVLLGLGIWNSFMIIASYLYARIFPSKFEETFEQWITNRFGKRLYTIFFKAYTEKVCGIPCSEIRAQWAEQRINGLSLLSALRSFLAKSPNTGNGKTIIKTLIDNFYYPRLGPGMMWQAVANIVQNNSSQVRLGAEVEGVLCTKNKIEALEVRHNGQKELVHGTHFISSMPLRELIHKFKPPVPEKVHKAASALAYRDFLTVALIVDKRDVFQDNWIYIHEPSIKLGRIQNFKNWSSHMVPDQDKTCLGLEYFCFEGDELWRMAEQELIELGKSELSILGLVDARDIEDGFVVRMPKAYPIYDSRYQESLRIIYEFISQIDNLQLVGRNGLHKYNNQDHSMLSAMRAVENILGENNDL
ncbi:MAG: NAD(P)/FAD-dependent oxidoreductase [Candidatus Brocadiales bacterium]|nr:NAD(P)/FAD-dependent oxidoreductase [Candidatus Brocadiales bacterium]